MFIDKSRSGRVRQLYDFIVVFRQEPFRQSAPTFVASDYVNEAPSVWNGLPSYVEESSDLGGAGYNSSDQPSEWRPAARNDTELPTEWSSTGNYPKWSASSNNSDPSCEWHITWDYSQGQQPYDWSGRRPHHEEQPRWRAAEHFNEEPHAWKATGHYKEQLPSWRMAEPQNDVSYLSNEDRMRACPQSRTFKLLQSIMQNEGILHFFLTDSRMFDILIKLYCHLPTCCMKVVLLHVYVR